MNYEEMTLVELRLEGKRQGIKSVTTFKKQELIERLKELNSVQEKPKKSENKKTSKVKTDYKENVDTDNNDKINNYNNHDNQSRNENKSDSRTDNRFDYKNDYKNENRGDSRYDNRPYQRGYNKSNNVTDYNKNIKRNQKPKQNFNVDEKELEECIVKEGILEIMPDGFGFLRCDNYLPSAGDVYVSPAMIRKYNLRTGDIVKGYAKPSVEKFDALMQLINVNNDKPEDLINRRKFDKLTPIFPDERLRLETPGCSVAMRIMDIISPIGMGQRGMIVSQPKTGKTTLIKQVAKSLKHNYPKMHILVLLIDERPEEVTDIKESIMGNNVEVIYSTFDELPDNHKRVSEMVIERAKRLVENGENVTILLDSITRLSRAYNLTVTPSGRTLSGGLDPAALYMPKKFFGAARNMREGGSLTILATALVDTGSKMDDVVFEEFKGTGNMEIVLDRSLSEKRLFPAIDFTKSSTRREDLLLRQDELEASLLMRRAFINAKGNDQIVERIIRMFKQTKDNFEFIESIRKIKLI